MCQLVINPRLRQFREKCLRSAGKATQRRGQIDASLAGLH